MSDYVSPTSTEKVWSPVRSAGRSLGQIDSVYVHRLSCRDRCKSSAGGEVVTRVLLDMSLLQDGKEGLFY